MVLKEYYIALLCSSNTTRSCNFNTKLNTHTKKMLEPSLLHSPFIIKYLNGPTVNRNYKIKKEFVFYEVWEEQLNWPKPDYK